MPPCAVKDRANCPLWEGTVPFSLRENFDPAIETSVCSSFLGNISAKWPGVWYDGLPRPSESQIRRRRAWKPVVLQAAEVLPIFELQEQLRQRDARIKEQGARTRKREPIIAEQAARCDADHRSLLARGLSGEVCPPPRAVRAAPDRRQGPVRPLSQHALRNCEQVSIANSKTGRFSCEDEIHRFFH